MRLSWGCHDVVMMRLSRGCHVEAVMMLSWCCHDEVVKRLSWWCCHEVVMRFPCCCHNVSNWWYFHKWWHTPWLKVEMLSHLKSLMMKLYLNILPATVIGNVAEGFPFAVVARMPVLIQKRGYLIKKNYWVGKIWMQNSCILSLYFAFRKLCQEECCYWLMLMNLCSAQMSGKTYRDRLSRGMSLRQSRRDNEF